MEHITFDKWKKLAGISKVYFAYYKLDGTYRKAVGTRYLIVAKLNGYDEEEGERPWDEKHSYFDYGKKAWRCYSVRCNDDIIIYDDEAEFRADVENKDRKYRNKY